MNRREVAASLEEIAELLEILGENPFKCRAFTTAARFVQSFDGDLREAVSCGTLARHKGVGPVVAERIAELVVIGACPYLQELRAQVPDGVRDLLRIPGLGPKRVRDMREQLGIASLGELEYVVQSRQLESLPGFGTVIEAEVLAAIEDRRRSAERLLLPRGLAAAAMLEDRIASIPGVSRVAIAGEVRRRSETIHEVEAVVAAEDPAVAAALTARDIVEDGEVGTERGGALVVRGRAFGARVAVWSGPPSRFAVTLVHRTGSEAHWRALCARATAAGLTLDVNGIGIGGSPMPLEEEIALYHALDLPFVEPELREGRGEVEVAAARQLPVLLEESDLAGVLHVHTTFSDGRDTLAEVVRAARARGHRYVGITDHSRSARYANGLDRDAIARQHDEIDRLQAELSDMRILKGIESDILADGALDYPDDLLAGFDFVIGSVHGGFGMSEPEMTARLLRALDDPHLDILGHLTGRLLLAREGYALHVDEVLAAAAARGVALELNANPARLDLDWRHVRAFQGQGGWIAIDPDAHRVEGLDDLRYGVAAARKGWSGRDRVLNALPAEALLERFRSRRAGAPGGVHR